MSEVPFKRKRGKIIYVEGHGDVDIPGGIYVISRYRKLYLDNVRYPDLNPDCRSYYFDDYENPIDCLYDALGTVEEYIKNHGVTTKFNVDENGVKHGVEIHGVRLLEGVYYYERYKECQKGCFSYVKYFHIRTHTGKDKTLYIPKKFHDSIEYIKEKAHKANEIRLSSKNEAIYTQY